MSPRFMPTEPTGRYKSLIDLMEQIDRGGFEEFQKEGIRRDRLFDIAMPGIEKMAELSGKILEGDFEDTAIGRATQSQAMRGTANLKKRIREVMAARGMSGQPLEASATLSAEISGGTELQRSALSQVPGAMETAGRTLPSLTALAQPRAPRVQTGALQYLGQVLPYNLNLEGMYDKWAHLLGRGEGEEQFYKRPPQSGIERLFDFQRN